MQQRVKFSSHRHGCPHFSAEETTSSPISLKIYKGSLENREDGQDLLQVLVVGNIDKNETSGIEEHHLQPLATSTVQIPIPGSIQLIENYAELYPSNRWMDTATYLQSAQTISEACSAALLDHDYIISWTRPTRRGLTTQTTSVALKSKLLKRRHRQKQGRQK
ncbi:hypothetical protein B0H13DRAFT_1929454 [Mycena leptocephala]|nr:hypothetical protein B0H13DRAFT_1929454 [Mycena leptocephala]